MDYSGSSILQPEYSCSLLFQSFCINGLLWKFFFTVKILQNEKFVSILLYQWITLEVNDPFFNKSRNLPFQSFCINGLLWKGRSPPETWAPFPVSILLYQWITLEDWGLSFSNQVLSCFNPSVSMDYSGSCL